MLSVDVTEQRLDKRGQLLRDAEAECIQPDLGYILYAARTKHPFLDDLDLSARNDSRNALPPGIIALPYSKPLDGDFSGSRSFTCNKKVYLLRIAVSSGVDRIEVLQGNTSALDLDHVQPGRLQQSWQFSW